jgi:hypothetical protein
MRCQLEYVLASWLISPVGATPETVGHSPSGAHTRHVAINHSSDQLYDTMTRYIKRHLLADEQPEIAQ